MVCAISNCMDHYQTLNVSKNASDDDLKKAYRKLAMENHPDRTGGDDTKFKQINEAYDTLKDPQKRAMYDQYGTADPQKAGPQGFHFHSGPGGFDMNDLFNQFGFGARQQMRNRDITIGCNISIADVFNGKNVIASYRLNNGIEQTVDIKIPVGIRNGDKIRYQGMGQHDIKQIPPGDLFVVIQVNGNNDFDVEGVDLLSTRKISVLKLILGTVIEVKVPNNSSINLSIPPGTQPGTTLRIAGKGLPNRNGNDGSIFVKIIGLVPKSLDSEDLKQIEYIDKKYS